MSCYSQKRSGVVIAPLSYLKHPLAIDNQTIGFIVPGTRSKIDSLVVDLNSVPYARFISIYPLISLIAIPIVVIASIMVTVYLYSNPWIYRVVFPLCLFAFMIPYCICYNKYVTHYRRVLEYYEFQLLNIYIFHFP